MQQKPETVTQTPTPVQEPWTPEDATALYMIDRWGAGYFSVDADGNLCVSPLQSKGATIPILRVVQEGIDQGLVTPMLIRFQDLLRHRVEALNEAFLRAIAENKYNGVYRGVYPIKVNQLREVVEEILDAGRPFNYGLEAGSKPEVCVGLALHSDGDSLIVCNGYKDTNFIRLALIGRKLGKRIVLVAEKLSEIRAIVQIAQGMGVEPLIGFRVRLLSKGSGKWATSGGEHAKFGLSTSEMLEGIKILRQAKMESALKLLHFHIGSQIPDILSIKRAVREGARYYAKLRKMGHVIEYVDVGGGLAIDYDGSRSTFHSSMNYTVEEYANDVVYNVMDVCDEEEVPHPTLVSESGRAVVAHHSVLVVEAFGAIEKIPDEPFTIKSENHKLIRDMRYIDRHLTAQNLNESYHDLLQLKEQVQNMFELGVLSLEVKARVESLFWQIANRIQKIVAEASDREWPEDLKNLKTELTDQHICNFSVFQSLPDHWALDQLFPVTPIHRLNESPTRKAQLVDITCDSDGEVQKFVDQREIKDALELHALVDGEPYYLAFLLIGAYQDTMGDMHNLFGRVHEAEVLVDDAGRPVIRSVRNGEVAAETMAAFGYREKDLVASIDAGLRNKVERGELAERDARRLLADYRERLRRYTYLG